MSTSTWTTLSDIADEPVNWLWEGRIPYGKITLLDGEPGIGKTALALEIAARVSRGTSMPHSKERGVPADVALFNDDDNLADTIRPRLESEGADLTRIRALNRAFTPDDFASFHPKLIVIDPLSAYLCFTCDAPPRKVFKELARLANETDAAVLVLQYLPKTGTSWAGEIYDAARSVLALSSIGHNRRRLALSKSNLRPIAEVRPLVFQIGNDDGIGNVSGWSDGV